MHWHLLICWPKLPVTLVITGKPNCLLVHISTVCGAAGGLGAPGIAGAPGTLGSFGNPDGSFGTGGGGIVKSLPSASWPSMSFLPRSWTCGGAGAVGKTRRLQSESRLRPGIVSEPLC